MVYSGEEKDSNLQLRKNKHFMLGDSFKKISEMLVG